MFFKGRKLHIRELLHLKPKKTRNPNEKPMSVLEPCVEDRKKFDIDLEYGKVREKQVADMLQDKKIEVKSERGMWQNTGNIAIEY